MSYGLDAMHEALDSAREARLQDEANAAAYNKASADFTLSGGGSVYLLTPNTEAAQEWVAEHIPGDALRWGGGIAIEHRFVDNVVGGAVGDGLSVEVA